MYAEGKEAVIVFTNDDVYEAFISKMADFGIRYIATRSLETDHIARDVAGLRKIKLANILSFSPQSIAKYAIMLALSSSQKIVSTVNSRREFDFRIDQLIGFSSFKKTVGSTGHAHVGQATAAIYQMLGMRGNLL